VGGSSRANLNLDRANLWNPGGPRGLEMKPQRFSQISQRLLFGLTLTGNVNFQAL